MARAKSTAKIKLLSLPDKGKALTGDEVPGHVYFTRDLDQFHFFAENRPIKRGSINAMKRSLLLCNLLKHSQVCVSPDGGIVDGQTRVCAVRELQKDDPSIGVYYTVLDAHVDPFDAMRQMNATSSPWSKEDYFHHHYVMKCDPYAYIWDRVLEKKELGFSIYASSALAIYGITNHELYTGKDRDIDDLDDRDKALDEIHSIAKSCAGFVEITHSKTIVAYMRCRQGKNFACENIIHFYNQYQTALAKRRAELRSNNPNHRLDVLTWMHNYNRAEKNHIKPGLL